METHRLLRQERLEREGLGAAEAAPAARRALGNVTLAREDARETWTVSAVAGLMQDARHAVRGLARRPLLTVAAIATLALAVGANIAIFSLIDRVILHPLDVPDPSRLVTVEGVFESRGVVTKRTAMNWYYAERVRGMSTLSAAAIASGGADRATQDMVVSMEGHGPVSHARGRFVTANYFRVLGLQPALGRDFGDDDDAVGAAPVVMLSHAFWQARMGGAADAVGRTVRINDIAALVVGVAPREFTGTSLSEVAPDIYLPVMTASRLATDIGSYNDGLNHTFFGARPANISPVSPLSMFTVIGRTRPGDVAQAQAELSVLNDTGQLVKFLVGTSRWEVRPVVETMLPFDGSSDIRRFLGVLAGAVGLTLLIGCANLTSLLLARSEERRGELAIRAALGAGRRRLIQSAAVEAMLLAAAGGVAALGVAFWIEGALSAFVLPGGVAVSSLRGALDVRLLLFALVATVVTAAVIGTAPAVRAGTRNLSLDARAEAAGSARLGLSRMLLGVQVAVCVVLVFLGAMFVRSVSNALGADFGFDRRNLVAAALDVPRGILFDTAASHALVDRVRRIPGVAAASVGPLPITKGSDVRHPEVTVDGQIVEVDEQIETVYGNADYFTTLGLSIVAGRGIDDRDRTGAPLVALVNEAAARQLWPGRDALEHRIGLPPPPMMRSRGNSSPDFLVVGIVRDAKVRSIKEADRPVMYMPRSQHETYLAGMAAGGGVNLVIRTEGSHDELANGLASVAAESGLTLKTLTSLDESLDGLLMPQRLGRTLLSLLGALASLLTIIGIYGLVSCAVARTTKAIGIRMALGANPQQVIFPVLRRTLLPVGAGLVVGSVVVRLGGHLVDGFAYGMRGDDPSTLVMTVGLIVVTGIVAAVLPARRALRINPIETLRAD